MSSIPDSEKQWFAMRDLKRPNTLLPAYRQLADAHIEVFTPMKWCLKVRNGKRIRVQIPFIQDLLFVHDSRQTIDPIVRKTPTLQYRYLKGGLYREPMIVSEADMQRFIRAVRASENPRYFLPGEITPAMYGRTVHIVGGLLNGYEGRLLTVRGSRTKRLIVELPNLLSIAVEVNTDYIQILP